jgi:hypothetical protein
MKNIFLYHIMEIKEEVETIHSNLNLIMLKQLLNSFVGLVL